jgi:phage terminase small subunit
LRALTEQQARFVAEFTSGKGAVGNRAEAARRAGYSPASASELGRQLLEKDHVRAAVDQALRDQIGADLAAQAIAVLREILEDEKAHPRLRLEASKTILDRAGMIAPKAEEPQRPGARKSLAEMSMEELNEFVRRGEEAMARAATARGNSSAVN